jgi:glycerol uptake operon antiterminator
MPLLAPPSANEFVARLNIAPCCPAIVSDDQLEIALASRARIVLILRGDGLRLRPTIDRIHERDKLVAVHLDLVSGLHADSQGVAWLARSGADAIITSHGRLMSVVRSEGVTAIQRLLLSRRSHLDTALTAIRRSAPDIVEVLPGVILPAVVDLMPEFDVPLLAGGFVRTEDDARAALAAGAIGVTTSTSDLWSFDGH